MNEVTNTSRSHILSLYRRILREGRQFPIYNRRRYVEMKVKTDFLTYKTETDKELIERQVVLAEDMLDSLIVMGESQREFFEWETDPVNLAPVNGKPARRQPPPRIQPKAPEEPIKPRESALENEF